MSLLGIDVGTSGCKTIVFGEDGTTLATGYIEYDFISTQAGYAELETSDIWRRITALIAKTVSDASRDQDDPIRALSVSSLGEAVVPISADRRILGSSILFFDRRGEREADEIATRFEADAFYRINGNTIGPHYTLPKLMWIKTHTPALYESTHRFLYWGSFVMFMLGAEAAVDYSLANRSLCFDLDAKAWSNSILEATGIDREKLPRIVASGEVVGSVSKTASEETGLPVGAAIVSGGHDQCVNATGCGVLESGQAMYGMGTFLCAAPIFGARPGDTQTMLEYGLNTEHHTRKNRFVSFIYNQGGALVKWHRDTFAATDHSNAKAGGSDVYDALFSELPEDPTEVVVLPYFTGTGPPRFYTDPRGTISGLSLGTTRGEILKGVLQGITFYLRRCLDALPTIGIDIREYRAVGGGSKSESWLQLTADILNTKISRAEVAEAGALGAAILAGAGCGVFKNFEEGVDAMVSIDRVFEPRPKMVDRYNEQYDRYVNTEALHEEIDFS